MDESTKHERFHGNKLTTNPLATYDYFHPTENGKDRFGNRIFKSPELAYLSGREKTPTKAALLISSAGNNFIQNNNGILSDIDKGLIQLGPSVLSLSFGQKNVEINPVELGNGRKMSYLASGAQSHVFLLEANQEKYIVKMRNPKLPELFSIFQPYINAMLQVQSVQADIGDELSKLGVVLPTYLFASGQVVCIKFEEGKHPVKKEVDGIKDQLRDITYEYINKEMRAENKLWNNVKVDLKNIPHRVFGKTSNLTTNMIKNSEGKLVWIDMFKYESLWLKLLKPLHLNQ